ncbi:MAG: class I SAM-dependent methyltransferase [Myxococcales bacterium]|nr:class I SAM-dependent methyltransferase [Myxococcales bacterium]MCB9714546.1 class I SAM-dependent methyltransferase [Myxococcales bacterium]
MLRREPAILGLLDHRLFEASSRSHFHSTAESYAQRAADASYMGEGNRQLARAVRASMAELVRSAPGGRIRILDVGAGVGAPTTVTLLRELASHSEGPLDLEICAVDHCREVVERTQALFDTSADEPEIGQWLASARCHMVDGSAMGFEAGSFDLVVCGFVLHHCNLLDKRDIVGEMLRVTRPGGLVALVDEFQDSGLHSHRYSGMSSCDTAGLECFVDLGGMVSIFESLARSTVIQARDGHEADGAWIMVAARRHPHAPTETSQAQSESD